MTQIPIPLRSNPGAYKLQGEPRLINCYPQSEGEELRAETVLIPSPGMKRFQSTDTEYPCRGMLYIEEDDRLYVAAGYSIWSIQENGTKTKLVMIPGPGYVYFARNDATNPQCVCVARNRAFIMQGGAAVYKRYHFIPSGVTFCGGYFVFWEDTGRFWVSELRGTEVDGLSFATAEADPDGLVKAHGSLNTLYLIGKRTIEVWGITGADFPFSRIGGAHLRFGSESPHTVADFANGVALVANDNVVYLINGYNYQRISSNEVTRLIEQEPDKASIVAFTYRRGPNKFYVLQGTGWTREYNAATGTWSDRRTGPVKQFDSLFHVEAWGKDIFGSRSLGVFSEIDVNANTENGAELVWGFDTSVFHAYPRKLTFDRIDMDFETGVGDLDTTVDPLVMLSWSDDNGRTVKELRHLPLGKQGEYGRRVRSGRLGRASEKGRMFSVRISDPVFRGLSMIDVVASPSDG